jgi:outer membrane protein assembly factor BamD (BamD/ComL family)
MGQHTWFGSNYQKSKIRDEIAEILDNYESGEIWLDECELDQVNSDYEKIHDELKVNEYHDVFRCYKRKENGCYVDDIRLLSLKETLDFINDPSNHCETYEYTIEQLKKFWAEYPDGFIEFG